jgi:hypothetical protein
MSDVPAPDAASILSELEAAAERRWGAERRAALAPNLQRTAEALATVAAFAVPAGEEPFPTGPEPGRQWVAGSG